MRMTSLPNSWLGMEMYVGRQVSTTTILDSFATENYTIYNLYTLASSHKCAPQGHADLLYRQYRVIVVTLSVFG